MGGWGGGRVCVRGHARVELLCVGGCECTGGRTRVYVHVCVSVCVCISGRLCVFACVGGCVCLRACVRGRVRMCVGACVRARAHTHLGTHQAFARSLACIHDYTPVRTRKCYVRQLRGCRWMGTWADKTHMRARTYTPMHARIHTQSRTTHAAAVERTASHPPTYTRTHIPTHPPTHPPITHTTRTLR